MGLKKSGVDFGALDGEPSRIIVLTLSPKDFPAPHVQFMAMISRALNDEGRARVLEAQSSEDVLETLLSTGGPSSAA